MELDTHESRFNFLTHAADHIMNSCLELDDYWTQAYEDATRILSSRAEAERKMAYRHEWSKS